MKHLFLALLTFGIAIGTGYGAVGEDKGPKKESNPWIETGNLVHSVSPNKLWHVGYKGAVFSTRSTVKEEDVMLKWQAEGYIEPLKPNEWIIGPPTGLGFGMFKADDAGNVWRSFIAKDSDKRDTWYLWMTVPVGQGERLVGADGYTLWKKDREGRLSSTDMFAPSHQEVNWQIKGKVSLKHGEAIIGIVESYIFKVNQRGKIEEGNVPTDGESDAVWTKEIPVVFSLLNNCTLRLLEF